MLLEEQAIEMVRPQVSTEDRINQEGILDCIQMVFYLKFILQLMTFRLLLVLED